MTTTTFFLFLIPVLGIILLSVNLILSPHNPYQEKDSAFECGFHSFLGQNRMQFSISFFIFALLFLLFDLEILLVYPYVVSAYTNGIYGLVIMLVFFLVLTLGFAFELGKNALKIESRQVYNFNDKSWKGYSLIYKDVVKYNNLNEGNAININTNAGVIVQINSIKVPWFIYLCAIGDLLAAKVLIILIIIHVTVNKIIAK